MLKDLDQCMEKWGSTGQFNPFDDIYHVRTLGLTFCISTYPLYLRWYSSLRAVRYRIGKLRTIRLLSLVLQSCTRKSKMEGPPPPSFFRGFQVRRESARRKQRQTYTLS